LHVLLRLKAADGHYIVTRHSLQAGKSNRCLPDNSLYAESACYRITV
jgi:hypothetical protein